MTWYFYNPVHFSSNLLLRLHSGQVSVDGEGELKGVRSDIRFHTLELDIIPFPGTAGL
jgi:hypothetical protein